MEHTKHQTEHSIRLTAPEIANLWTNYMNDSMAICVLKYMLEKVEDREIRPVFEYALELAKVHVKTIAGIFKEEGYPVPYGFTDEDVNLKAPRLFADTFGLDYLLQMTVHGLTGYALSLTTSTRSDIRDYYIHCNETSMELYQKSINVLLSKGLYSRPPYIATPEKVDFVERQSFLNGWFEGKRPLNSLEISHIFFNLKKTIMTRALLIGFSQVAKSKEVRALMVRGTDIGLKHIDAFSSILHKNNLPSPKHWESEVTNSTVPPFSDKLMTYHALFLINTAVGFYGTGMSVSMRKDLVVQYQRIITETQVYVEDGANIMINNGWMEQPPQVEDRKQLVRL
ncbi:DUF3231 family protein [Aneurinibacillus sp. Ricciae_BoGa-3]|uniref:DUF3231 family protein n=1 Tax=Aneurinibacillus sp. Ricciae_BoGa-3 TaxID=3022697 RepID=UPI00234122DF|nr:DUF3231 family protein [Aneurinibacillus sp. Ricciae_BoGa-3]WCK56384.1 DUF3231 family protein [Aneurinibacillus sp. Ricciae_BoGa-3]